MVFSLASVELTFFVERKVMSLFLDTNKTRVSYRYSSFTIK